MGNRKSWPALTVAVLVLGLILAALFLLVLSEQRRPEEEGLHAGSNDLDEPELVGRGGVRQGPPRTHPPRAKRNTLISIRNEQGKPVSGANVCVSSAMYGQKLFGARSGEQGLVSFKYDRPPSLLRIAVEHPRFAHSSSLAWISAGSRHELTLRTGCLVSLQLEGTGATSVTGDVTFKVERTGVSYEPALKAPLSSGRATLGRFHGGILTILKTGSVPLLGSRLSVALPVTGTHEVVVPIDTRGRKYIRLEECALPDSHVRVCDSRTGALLLDRPASLRPGPTGLLAPLSMSRGPHELLVTGAAPSASFFERVTQPAVLEGSRPFRCPWEMGPDAHVVIKTGEDLASAIAYVADQKAISELRAKGRTLGGAGWLFVGDSARIPPASLEWIGVHRLEERTVQWPSLPRLAHCLFVLRGVSGRLYFASADLPGQATIVHLNAIALPELKLSPVARDGRAVDEEVFVTIHDSSAQMQSSCRCAVGTPIRLAGFAEGTEYTVRMITSTAMGTRTFRAQSNADEVVVLRDVGSSTMRARVTDSNGQPVSGIVVAFRAKNEELLPVLVTTDASGLAGASLMTDAQWSATVIDPAVRPTPMAVDTRAVCEISVVPISAIVLEWKGDTLDAEVSVWRRGKRRRRNTLRLVQSSDVTLGAWEPGHYEIRVAPKSDPGRFLAIAPVEIGDTGEYGHTREVLVQAP